MRQTILRSDNCCNSSCEHALVAYDSNGTAGGSRFGMHRTVAEGVVQQIRIWVMVRQGRGGE